MSVPAGRASPPVSRSASPSDERELRDLAAAYVAAGYRRLKCKIEPGADRAVVAAVRAEVGDAITLAVDANGAYDLTQSDALHALDEFGLQCIEQPLSPDSLRDHATLARGLRTRVCLDESVTSVGAAMDALAWQACDMVNIKPGRVGGVDVARTVHDLCVVAGVPAVIGGMLETGVGRAVNVALASLPGFTEAGDLSASDRYFAEDVTEPFVLDGGQLMVPDRPRHRRDAAARGAAPLHRRAGNADGRAERARYCGGRRTRTIESSGASGSRRIRIGSENGGSPEYSCTIATSSSRGPFERVGDPEESRREHGARRGLLELVDASLLGRRVFVVVVHHAPSRLTPLAGTQVATGSTPAPPSIARPTTASGVGVRFDERPTIGGLGAGTRADEPVPGRLADGLLDRPGPEERVQPRVRWLGPPLDELLRREHPRAEPVEMAATTTQLDVDADRAADRCRSRRPRRRRSATG